MAVKKIKPTGPASDPNLLNRNSSVSATGPAAAIKNSVKAVNSIQPPAPSSPIVPNTVVPNQNVQAPAPSNTFSPNVAAQLGSIIGQNANAQLNGQSPSDFALGKSSNGRVSDRTNNYYSQMQSVERERPDPFESRYESQIQGILDTIYNRKPFDIKSDANYNQLYDLYKEQYIAQADKSMRDTMASMNAATGGYGSTYSGAVAQQAYDNTMQQLNDRNMQLMQLAYGMYADDRANDYQKLGAFQGQDGIEYGRYRDTVSDWQNDRNYYASQYWNSTGDDENRYQYDDSTEYGRYNDAVSMAMQLASQGLPVPDYLTAQIDNYNSKYGLSGSDAQSQLALLASQALATKGGSGGSGGGNKTKPKATDMGYYDADDYDAQLNGNVAHSTSHRTNINALGELINNADSDQAKYNLVLNAATSGIISTAEAENILDVEGLSDKKNALNRATATKKVNIGSNLKDIGTNVADEPINSWKSLLPIAEDLAKENEERKKKK